jgi:5-aminolevulinate synthase
LRFSEEAMSSFNPNLRAFQVLCPYLRRTSAATLRSMATQSMDGVTRLRIRAETCPVIGNALAMQRREYAAVANRKEIDEIHRKEGVDVRAGQGGVCPHAEAGRSAAMRAKELADQHKEVSTPADERTGPHMSPHISMHRASAGTGKFDYEAFYAGELDKKHKDKSYRYVSAGWLSLCCTRRTAPQPGLRFVLVPYSYFNNINRLAKRFPVAHTADAKEEVTVWCSNDYLGMGGNPLVVDAMKCVTCPPPRFFKDLT